LVESAWMAGTKQASGGTAMSSHKRSRSGCMVVAIAMGAALVAGPSLAGSTAKGARLDPITTSGTAPAFGAYDPSGAFGGDKTVGIEHLFLPWQDVDLTTLKSAETYAKERNRTLLVTIEPWTWSKEWRTSPEQLRDDILAGKHDSN